jgi:hypothetical protein
MDQRSAVYGSEVSERPATGSPVLIPLKAHCPAKFDLQTGNSIKAAA